MEQRNIRIVAVGDDLLAGVGDPRTLGWFGRVMARTPQTTASIAAYNLAAPNEGSEQLNARWFEEARRRFVPGADNRLVIAPSTFDIDLGLTSARSRLNLANIVDMASQNNIKPRPVRLRPHGVARAAPWLVQLAEHPGARLILWK